MKLSIIVPAYNVEKYITECLDSLLNQGLDENIYEIIIVNDGSTDNTLEVSNNYAAKYPHIKIFNKENGGASSARNYGINIAKGKYIYFIDSDDYLMANCLNKILHHAEQQNLDILTFLSRSFTMDPKHGEPILVNSELNFSFGDDEFSPVVTGKDYIANANYRHEVCCYLIKRDFIKNSPIRFVEGRYLEDAVFTTELFLLAERMSHLHLDVHRYRTTPGSAMTSVEPNHYLKIIRDMQFAAMSFDPVIKTLQNSNVSAECVERIKSKQQSLIFFSMIRMLRSTMSFKEIKQRMQDLIEIEAYPLDMFIKSDDNDRKHKLLAKLLNRKHQFYALYHLMNPILKHRYKHNESRP